jgi:Catalytic LigB subunit of aromatic ring-opening dioxygenase
MARLVGAFASSHSVMLTCTLQDWQRGFRTFDLDGSFYDRKGDPCTYRDLLALAPPNAADLVTDAAIARRFEETHAGMRRMKATIAEAKLDVLVICGDDQRELFTETLMPSIGVYYDDTIRNGVRRELPPSEWYKRAQMLRLEEREERRYPVESGMARHFIEGLCAAGFDVAALKGLLPGQHEGHAFSFMHRTYLQDRVVPIVPVFLNTFFPPNQPTPARCLALGGALRSLIDSYPGEARVGFMASGGLSHFCAEEDLDLAVIDALRRKDRDFLARLDVKRLQSGSSEIRNWIVLAGAAPDFDLDWVSYTPGYRTEALTGTGLAFASWRRAA